MAADFEEVAGPPELLTTREDFPVMEIGLLLQVEAQTLKIAVGRGRGGNYNAPSICPTRFKGG